MYFNYYYYYDYDIVKLNLFSLIDTRVDVLNIIANG